MKKFLLLLTFILATTGVFSQTEGSGRSCYTEYYTTFRDRGAKAVGDGVHEVVVSIRKEGECICLQGKITVKNGLPINDLWLAREDGTFEKFVFVPSPKYSKSETQFTNYISNGMTPTYLSKNEELINLFFVKVLNPVAANYKSAPPLK